MSKQHLGKLLLLALLLAALCLALSGCIVDPDAPVQTNNTGTWNRYTEAPTNTPEPPQIETSTPDPNVQSWDEPTPGASTNTPVPVIGAATIVPGLSGTTTPSVAPGSTTSSVLKRGSQGTAVANVQAALKRLGYFEGKTDGDFGEYTENAVKAFQRQNGLTADGVVGAATLAKLSSSSAATARPTSTPTPKATATPRPTATPSYANTYLSKGNSGTKVTQMQNQLISLGYLLGSASGKVCDITEQAIISFQQRNSLTADGVAGPGTLEKLYSGKAKKASGAVGIIGMTLKLGNEGSEVKLLQSRLKSYGFLKGSADGIFGTATETAVKDFQRANGLTADGKAGYSTLQKLFAGSVTTASQAKATATPKRTATPKPTAKATATPKATAKATATPKTTSKPTPTPNAYLRVTAAPNGEYVTLERGHMGSLVTKLQKALKSAGYFTGKVDGYYGEETEEAVKKFQKDKGLKQDGKAGPATQRYLYEGDFPSGA